MHLFCIALLFAALPLFSDSVIASDASVRGVDPELASRYAGEVFTCLDGALTVQSNAVNDDYCDCFDGSDEPGTAACLHGTFYCHNRGFRPQSLPSFFVNDAVCDCCDGSDEGHGQCENTCFDLGEELRQQLKQKQDVYASALKEKSSRLGSTDSIADGWKEELKSCMDEIDRQKERCDALQQNVDVLQEEERKQKELEEMAKQDTATNASDNEALQNDSSDSQETEQEDGERSEEKSAGDEEEPSDTENVVSVDADDGDDAEVEAEGEYTTEDDSEDPLNDYDDEEDAEDEEDQIEEGAGITKEEDADRDDDITEEKDAEEEQTSLLKRVRRSVTSLFSKKKDKKRNIQKASSHRPKKTQTEESDLTKLRREHSKEKRELRNLETKRDALQSKIDRDYGPESKFISLADKCFELKQDKYTYEICPFDKASQKERHSSVNLGKFEGFGELYEWMEFHHGQLCAHGKSRSLRVHFHCGQEDGIDFVTEPDICEYLANFSTPLACSEAEFELLKQEADHLGMSMKDEL